MSRFKRFLIILLGASILSFGIYNIHSRCPVTEGGELGMELLIQHFLHISPSITGFVLDLFCYLIGFLTLGKSFLKTALLATVCYCLTYALWEQFPPVLPDLSQMPLWASLLGAVFVGVGTGIVVKSGGACSGDDALAMSLSKLIHKPIERCYMITDYAILLLSLTYIPVKDILYSILTVTLSSLIIGWMQHIRLPERKKHA